MKRKRIISLLVFAAFTVLSPFHAFSAPWSQVNTDAFGLVVADTNIMKVFNSKLYSCTGDYRDPLLLVYDGGTGWSQVNTPNIMTDRYNQYCGAIGVFNNELAIGVDNLKTGTEVWSWDGVSAWTQINTDGFGDKNNTYVWRLRVWNGKLYASTNNTVTGGEVWEYSGSGTTWTQVNSDGFGDPKNEEAHVYVANNKLYATTHNDATGSEVYEYSGSGTAWTQINTPGFGDGAVTWESDVAGFNNDLYAGTMRGASAKVWKYSGSGTTWTQVNTDGFGDSNNIWARLFSINSQLYAATRNNTTGAEVWQYSGSGTKWTQVNTDGFGDSNNVRILSMVVFQNLIYAGTANSSTGAEVWSSTGVAPLPSITGNGASGQLSITTTDTLTVSISLNAGGDTAKSDWWLVYSGPNNQWNHLDLSSQSFKSGLAVSYQGALVDMGPNQVFNSTLGSAGVYTFYFGVDTQPDGAVTSTSAYYDTLVVKVQ